MGASRYLVRVGILGAMMAAMVALSAAVATAGELPDASCNVTSDYNFRVGVATGPGGPGDSSTVNYQVAQTFTAVSSGRLTSASVMLFDIADMGSLAMEVRPVDGASNAPGKGVLATASVAASDIPAGPDHTLVSFRFNPGAEVVAGQRYALVLGSIHGSFRVAANSSNPCPDGWATNTSTGVFEGVPDGTDMTNTYDLIFSTFVDVAPVATNDAYSTAQGRPLRVAAPGLLSNDSDLTDDALTAAKVTNPARGEVFVNADGSFAYFPDAGYVGIDSFIYRASDGALQSDAATVRIRVKDTTKPTISPVSPKPTSTIRDTTPTIKATVKDNFTNLQKANVKLYVNGALISPTKYAYSAATDVLTHNSSKLSKGKKTVKIVATDAARNVGTKSWSFTIK